MYMSHGIHCISQIFMCTTCNIKSVNLGSGIPACRKRGGIIGSRTYMIQYLTHNLEGPTTLLNMGFDQKRDIVMQSCLSVIPSEIADGWHIYKLNECVGISCWTQLSMPYDMTKNTLVNTSQSRTIKLYVDKSKKNNTLRCAKLADQHAFVSMFSKTPIYRT